MRVRLPAIVLFVISGFFPVPAASGQSAKPEKAPPARPKLQKIALSKVAVKPGSYRMGYEDKRDPPETGWQAKIGTDTFVFFDLAEHDKLEPDIDGMALLPYPFIVAIPDKLLLKTGQYKVSFEGTKTLILDPDDLGSYQSLAPEAAVMTEIRIRSAVRPVALDPKKCADCEKHCDYLKLNKLADGSGGLASHQEDPAKPGYTPEGAEAGRKSDIGFTGNITHAILGLYASVWHAVPIVDPRLREFAVGHRNGVNMVYFTATEGSQDRISTLPPDGGIGFPRSFCEEGEYPNPALGTDYGKGCGFPIFVRLVTPYRELLSAEVTDGAGKRVAGTVSSPAKPANPEWPTNSNCAAFIPSKPLFPNMLYRVKFTFKEDSEPVSWSFTTGK
ncbi:MAG TPA: hypothetical protein VKU80_09955 [Planctomycetota bacterium]|nr:hypothetical protein [Planctomycetota bacterium]